MYKKIDALDTYSVIRIIGTISGHEQSKKAIDMLIPSLPNLTVEFILNCTINWDDSTIFHLIPFVLNKNVIKSDDVIKILKCFVGDEFKLKTLKLLIAKDIVNKVNTEAILSTISSVNRDKVENALQSIKCEKSDSKVKSLTYEYHDIDITEYDLNNVKEITIMISFDCIAIETIKLQGMKSIIKVMNSDHIKQILHKTK